MIMRNYLRNIVTNSTRLFEASFRCVRIADGHRTVAPSPPLMGRRRMSRGRRRAAPRLRVEPGGLVAVAGMTVIGATPSFGARLAKDCIPPENEPSHEHRSPSCRSFPRPTAATRYEVLTSVARSAPPCKFWRSPPASPGSSRPSGSQLALSCEVVKFVARSGDPFTPFQGERGARDCEAASPAGKTTGWFPPCERNSGALF
jgi:hypothetical protein